MTRKKKDETTRKRITDDSLFLGPLSAGRFSIGVVDEVNGAGAIEEPSFIPTRHELFQLAKYWIEVELDIRYWWFLHEQVGSSEIRLRPFAIRRTAQIARVLGEAEIEEAEKQVLEKFSAETNSVLWEMFLAGKRLDRDEKGFPIIPPVPATTDCHAPEGSEAG